jgi:hypothetical protein
VAARYRSKHGARGLALGGVDPPHEGAAVVLLEARDAAGEGEHPRRRELLVEVGAIDGKELGEDPPGEGERRAVHRRVRRGVGPGEGEGGARPRARGAPAEHRVPRRGEVRLEVHLQRAPGQLQGLALFEVFVGEGPRAQGLDEELELEGVGAGVGHAVSSRRAMMREAV